MTTQAGSDIFSGIRIIEHREALAQGVAKPFLGSLTFAIYALPMLVEQRVPC